MFSVQGLNLFVHLKSWFAAGSQIGLPLSTTMLCLKWEEESLRQEKDLNKARGSYGRRGLAGTVDRLTVPQGWWSPFSEQQKRPGDPGGICAVPREPVP